MSKTPVEDSYLCPRRISLMQLLTHIVFTHAYCFVIGLYLLYSRAVSFVLPANCGLIIELLSDMHCMNYDLNIVQYKMRKKKIAVYTGEFQASLTLP